jgi:hypothetical protein
VFGTRLVAIAAAVGICLAAPAGAFAQNDRSGYASVNGLEMYYEIHGAGRPLVLLHGALMTIEGFKELLPSLAKTRQVIAVEQQAHGRTADIDRALRYEQMADDTVAWSGSSGSSRPISSATAWAAASPCRSRSGIRT